MDKTKCTGSRSPSNEEIFEPVNVRKPEPTLRSPSMVAVGLGVNNSRIWLLSAFLRSLSGTVASLLSCSMDKIASLKKRYWLSFSDSGMACSSWIFFKASPTWSNKESSVTEGCIRAAMFFCVAGKLSRICKMATDLATLAWMESLPNEVSVLLTEFATARNERSTSLRNPSYKVTVLAKVPICWSASATAPSPKDELSIKTSWMILIADLRPIPPLDFANLPSNSNNIWKWWGRNG